MSLGSKEHPAMKAKPVDQLGELQRTVLEALWEVGEAGVQEIVDRLGPERPLAYTTVLTTLQNLEKAGWVGHTRRGRAYVYRPRKTREQAGVTSLRAFIKRAFANDAGLLFQTLIENEQLSDEELSRLRALIDAKRREVQDE
jgi:BlaI family transcriptional regulator, penicillinase repressor